MAQERLNKVMANAGIASRRACDEMIQAGRVTVNGQVVTALGVKVDPARDQIRVDGEALKPRSAERRNYLMLYKPAGVLSVFDDPRGRPGLESLLKGPLRLYPVGRLDLDSEGLLLLTDDGDLTLKLSHPRFEHAKSYLVLVDRPPGSDTLARYRRGIQLDDGVTAPSQWRVLEHPAMVSPSDDPAAAEGVWLHVTMHEGRKRQIRRMARAENLEVRRLVRIGLGSLRLDRKLKPGESRPLTHREIEQLLAEVRSQTPAVVPRRRKGSDREAGREGPSQPRAQSTAGKRPSQRQAAGSQAGPSGAARRVAVAGLAASRPGPRPSGPKPGAPRRAEAAERDSERRGPQREDARTGRRPSGPKSGPPRRAETAERDSERRGPQREDARTGRRPSGPKSGPPRRAETAERDSERRGPQREDARTGRRPSGPKSGPPRRAETAERGSERRGPQREDARTGRRPSGPKPGAPGRAAPGRGPARRGPQGASARPAAQPFGARAPSRRPPERADAPASDDRPARVPRRSPTAGKPRPSGGRPAGRKPGSGARPAGKKTGKR